MANVNTMESMHFQKLIAASSSGNARIRIKDLGTVEELRVRLYPGQQKSLRVNAVIMHRNQRVEPLITYLDGGDTWISGDDDYFVFRVVIPVEYDDEVVIYYENTDASNAYTLSVQVMVDYYGGDQRVIGGVVSG